jgi:SAM-dependent methyltransferase
MHLAVRRFLADVRRELPHKFRFRKVLEIGSKSINGSPRKYFWFCKYTGIDLSEGKGVDIVADFTSIVDNERLFSEKFDVVISTEMLEHCDKWKEALERMFFFLKDGGLMIMTCAGEDREPHGTITDHPECSPDTLDYYRNITKEDFKSVLPSNLFDIYVLMNGRDKQDLYFYGIKKYAQNDSTETGNKYQKAIKKYLK